jgi:hypothetical protein
MYTDIDGDVKILDVTTGTTMQVQKLTDLTIGLLEWHGPIVFSPDRNLFLCINDRNTSALVCTTAGAVVARWHLKYSYPDWIFGYAQWCPDSRHWICVYSRYPRGIAGALIYDTLHPDLANTHAIHISSAFAEGCDINQTGVHSLQIPTESKAGTAIRIYSGKSVSDDQPVVSLLSVDRFNPAPQPDQLQGEFSPSGRFILWRSKSYEHKLRFHTSWPFVSRDTFDSGENEWLSDQHGHGLRYIGHLPTRSNGNEIQSHIEWLPGDKGFSYFSNDKLYVYWIE